MSYQFNSMLFDTPYRRDRAIAESWLYADGLNDEDAPTLESMIEAFRDLAA